MSMRAIGLNLRPNSSTAFSSNPNAAAQFSRELNSVSGFDRRYLPIMHWLSLCSHVLCRIQKTHFLGFETEAALVFNLGGLKQAFFMLLL